MKKFRNYGFWIGLTGAVILLLQTIGKYFGFVVNSEMINEIVTCVCGILVLLGVLIKPSSNDDQNQDDDTKDNSNNNPV